MKDWPWEKLCPAAALLLVVASVMSFGPSRMHSRTFPAPPSGPLDGAYVPWMEVPLAGTDQPTWSAPDPLVRETAWAYEVFAPPEVFYRLETRNFEVRSRGALAPSVEPQPVMELMQVQPELFRLQLLGYAGEAGDWLGIFENVETSETFLAQPGDRIEKLGLLIVRLEVEFRPLATQERSSMKSQVISAVVRDERTGDETILVNRERAFSGKLRAKLREGSQEGRIFEVGEGDLMQLRSSRFRVRKIQLAPPLVEVTEESGGNPGVTVRKLEPMTPSASSAADFES